jgi:hypothetical protein
MVLLIRFNRAVRQRVAKISPLIEPMMLLGVGDRKLRMR